MKSGFRKFELIVAHVALSFALCVALVGECIDLYRTVTSHQTGTYLTQQYWLK